MSSRIGNFVPIVGPDRSSNQPVISRYPPRNFLILSRIHQPNKNFPMHDKPNTQQETKLPDQIADAWAAVLIDIYQRLKEREEAKPKDKESK